MVEIAAHFVAANGLDCLCVFNDFQFTKLVSFHRRKWNKWLRDIFTIKSAEESSPICSSFSHSAQIVTFQVLLTTQSKVLNNASSVDSVPENINQRIYKSFVSLEKMEIFVLLKKLLVVIGFRNANHPKKEAIKVFLRMTTIALLVTGGTTSSYFGIIKTETFAEVAETFAFVNMMCYSTSSQLAFWTRWSPLKRIMESMQHKICERLSTLFFWAVADPVSLYEMVDCLDVVPFKVNEI